MYINYSYGCYKIEIRDLLRQRISMKDKIRTRNKRIEKHKQARETEKEALAQIEKNLDKYLSRKND